MATTNLYEHNIPVYEALEKMLSEYGKAILVTATGTGKSHVVLEYIQKHNLKTLVVSPRLAINRQWEEHSTLITTITYQSFPKLMPEQVNSYGCVVFDEAHHCGSKVWGTAVKLFMDQAKIPIIGLTADSIRWMDEGKDVANELWEGHVVRGYDQAEAIQKGILPRLTYVSALFDCAGLSKTYRENNTVSDVLKRKLALTEKNCGSVVSILQKHMPAEKRKGIVFAASVVEVPEAIRLMKEAFPDCNIAAAHSGLPQAVSETAIREFTKAASGFLVTVDMLNEGVHIHGVNTIIMLRRTGSPNLYMQQCGRGLASGGETPIIFDFVGNSENVKKVRIWVTEGRSRTIKEYQKRVPAELVEQVIVYDYACEFLSVLEEIKDSLKQVIMWTEEEDKILKKYWPSEGSKVIERLPGRTPAACGMRARLLGFGKNQPAWTEEEDEILKKYWPGEGRKVSARLPGRTSHACGYRARLLGLKYFSYWTAAEDDILRTYYPVEGKKVSERLPRRNPLPCVNRANFLGIKRQNKKYTYSTKWSKDEEDILRKYYPTEGRNVSKRIGGRSERNCVSKASCLGIKYTGPRNFCKNPWTEKDKKILIKHYEKDGPEICALLTGRTKTACCDYARRHLGLYRRSPSNSSSKKKSPWTNEEENILREHYEKDGSTVCSQLTGRSRKACIVHAHLLGLHFSPSSKEN